LALDRRIVVASPGSVELGEEALDPESIIAGSPETFDGEISSAPLADGSSLATGVWRCTPGTVTDVEVDETFVVLSGRASIEHAGRTHEVGPGDVCVLPAGAKTKWTVHETLTKVYVLVDVG
jgi:uncharacterized cupin superfamily protein